MDAAFLQYYEEELIQLRDLAREYAALHPNVARNLSLDTVPCPDPYVERLLEGVAYLAARTRMKVDAEGGRFVRNLLDMLYPDLAGPGPAMSVAQLKPGPQVVSMVNGHLVKHGTRLISGLREGLATRAVYTTAQDVRLWPVELTSVEYLQDASALSEAGVPERMLRESAAGLRFRLARAGPGTLAELSLDRLDLHFGAASRGGALFDSLFGFGTAVIARAADDTAPFRNCAGPTMIGLAAEEAILPRVRPSFEGYRLLREYFLMPERFLGLRVEGLQTAVRDCTASLLEIVVLLKAEQPTIAEVRAGDFRLFATPLVNLFEHECNLVDLAAERSAHAVHADRTRPRDYEIYRLLTVEDAEAEGAEAVVAPLFAFEGKADSGYVYSTERRPRRPGEDEIRRGQMRTSYAGDNFYISVARPAGSSAAARPLRRLDIRALCTNRDLPILDDSPTLTFETGDPVQTVTLLHPFRRPRPSLRASLPTGATGEAQMEDLTWRWVAQLGLNHLSLAEGARGAEPLRALVGLYADRGDPQLARHWRALVGVTSRPLVERLALAGPICFGQGTEIVLDIDESVLTGSSKLLLSAVLAHLFERHAAINSFVRTRARLVQQQKEVAWPVTPGTRALI